MQELALLEIKDRVATLTLNRPEARNALSLDLLGALHAQVDRLKEAPDISVLILTSEGKSFCAGMDLKEVLIDPDTNPKTPLNLLTSLAEFAIKLRALPVPVIAAIKGAAIGGGCGLTCVCDFSITHADCKMGFPEVDLGLCPAVVAPWVVRRLGPGKARTLLLAGGLISGADASEMGLVTNLVGTRDDVDAAAADLASKLAAGGPRAIAATKMLLNELDGSLDEDLALRGAALSAQVLTTPEAQQALRARAR